MTLAVRLSSNPIMLGEVQGDAWLLIRICPSGTNSNVTNNTFPNSDKKDKLKERYAKQDVMIACQMKFIPVISFGATEAPRAQSI